MQTASRSYNAQELKMIGRIVCKINPDIADNIIKLATITTPADFSDLSSIKNLLNQFCSIKQKKTSDVVGVNKGREATQLKQLFIAVIIKLFNPEVLKDLQSDRMKKNLRRELSEVLQCNAAWISQTVASLPTHLQVYESFNEEVNSIVTVLKSFKS